MHAEAARIPQAEVSAEEEDGALAVLLERRALDERVETWVKELRARADVRYAPAPALGP
jgi:hypothetical protein